ncbi:MAG: trypsin-like peptidase domain-containing protein [Planctomycetes bacterium]|nr:trypsin-like peptidase domain-containing protein [Planctomycetota bacterium]MCB9935179.1 trypsin-like peptidase domain-containing protein [Planctomycetota bacterium]
MKKIIAAIALSLMLGGVVSHADNSPPKSNSTVEKSEAELIKLVDQLYPAFVLIGGGSGVAISEDGYFITNHHVWNQAAAPATMAVKMAGNSRQFTADAVGADPRGDIVLGKLRLNEGETVPFVKLGDSDKVQIGDLCLSIGNPFLLSGRGSEPTVTFGTVTCNNRFQGGYNDCIQIDTAINPGNSGGPSFNVDGEMIGINGRNIASHGKRYNTGAGYAIPANQIRNFLETLKAQSGGALVVRHGMVGGLILDMGSQKGAVVRGVEDNSDAHDAGFQPGDVITAMDDKPVFNAYRYYGIVGTKPRGSSFAFTVTRGDEKLTLTARNGVPTESGQFGTVPRPDDEARKGSGNNPFGAMMDPFQLPKMKSSLGFKGEYNSDRAVGGYKITGLKNGSPLLEAGMAEGDILTKLNGREIRYFADLHDILIATEPGTEVSVTYIRGGETFEVKARTTKAK